MESMWLDRQGHAARVRELLASNPVVGVVGPRQVGKSALAARIAAGEPGGFQRFDLEDPRDAARLEAPMMALEPLRGLVVLDEIQHRPNLFPSLRVLADRPGVPARFLVLGSASVDLLRQGSESLAGRIAWHRLGGFDLSEISSGSARDLWVRGGFPRSFLASSEVVSNDWRREFIATYLERDLAQFGIRVPAVTMRRFWTMLAHYHGQTWNGAELARAFGVTEKSVRRYLDILQATFMVRRLDPWFENAGKRAVKSPCVYLADSGVLHTLLGIQSSDDLLAHPKVGASWEGFVIDQIVRRLGARDDECFSFGLYGGPSLDLLVVRGRRRLGFEIKFTDEPRTSRSMHAAIEHLELESLDVFHAGQQTFPMGERIRAVALERILEDLQPLDRA